MALAYNNDDQRKSACGIVVEPTTKRKKLRESMENTIIIPDDVLRNILSRLSAKPLMRFRCASKHWNSLITDPHFMNSRSRRMILMHSSLAGLCAFDPKHQNVVKLTYPFEHQIYGCKIIGTLNGIVFLVLQKGMFGACTLILYNPLTRATKEVPGLPPPCCRISAINGCLYGFGHGNIIIGKPTCICPSRRTYNNCNVFSLKNGSWSTPKTTFVGGPEFVQKVGMFLDGFLHWIACSMFDEFYIVVLDVTEMRPFDKYIRKTNTLGRSSFAKITILKIYIPRKKFNQKCAPPVFSTIAPLLDDSQLTLAVAVAEMLIKKIAFLAFSPVSKMRKLLEMDLVFFRDPYGHRLIPRAHEPTRKPTHELAPELTRRPVKSWIPQKRSIRPLAFLYRAELEPAPTYLQGKHKDVTYHRWARHSLELRGQVTFCKSVRGVWPDKRYGETTKEGQEVVTEEDQETPDLREMIAAEVGEALHDMLSGYFAQMKDELKKEMRSQVEAVVEASVAARPGGSGGSGGGQPRVTTYKDFSACQPPQFNGQKDPVASSRWISEVEGVFLTSSCSEEVKARYASNLLRKAAKDWWNLINRTRTPEQIATMTWEQFKEQFKEQYQYVPQVEVERLTGEFLAMKQTTETVNEITDLFLERSLFCPDYVASERMKMYRYAEVLKPEIREFVVMAECKTFHRMHEVARSRELELKR
ncbi:hypothetical protein OSB04_007530 [Centaurea solstitialis]|uniref:F-box domain-containing protein n=1 Tax=Centaurea solstitialis TaxID=347529 RepID=A0AA38WQX3_9ASTR|nr:hypothetical protein OSB04_007530 [Centaurea solstitialis]